jgi:hypothetical protein
MTRLTANAAPVWYGSDRNTVHIAIVAYGGHSARPGVTVGRPLRGYCDRTQRDRINLTLAYGVSVTCDACLTEANRRATAKEARKAGTL